jgi:hypothetical protein
MARQIALAVLLHIMEGASLIKTNKNLGLILLGALGVLGVASREVKADEQTRSFEIYGFAQADEIQDSKRVDPNWTDAFRPSKIGVEDAQGVNPYGANGDSDISVKQSRFGVKGSMPTGEGHGPLTFKFEFDLFGVGVDAGQTTFRLRHAYGEWEQVLAGQTNSLFMDGDIFPNTIDYWGPNGMVFLRNPQIRWTPYKTETASFAIAIERPGNDIDPGNIRLIDEYSNASLQSQETVPDLTSHFRLDGSWGHFQIAAIVRRIGYEYQTVAGQGAWTTGSKTGWGVNLSAGIKTVGKDQILLQVVHGDGIASYMNDGGTDLAPNAYFVNPLTPTISPLSTVPTLSAEAVPLTGVVAYYDHYWNEKFSSSIGYSSTQVDNTNFQTADAFHKAQYASVNLLWTPVSNFMMGGEVLWGDRQNNDGLSGRDWRFQFTLKYNFGIKL